MGLDHPAPRAQAEGRQPYWGMAGVPWGVWKAKLMPEKTCRGRPGRPRKLLPDPEDGHSSGTGDAEARVNRGPQSRPTGLRPSGPVAQMPPRLLDLQGASAYLGVSAWTIRDLEHAGHLPRVRVPMPPLAQRRPRNGKNGGGSGELRKLLFDRADLDQCIERWKEKAGDNRR